MGHSNGRSKGPGPGPGQPGPARARAGDPKKGPILGHIWTPFWAIFGPYFGPYLGPLNTPNIASWWVKWGQKGAQKGPIFGPIMAQKGVQNDLFLGHILTPFWSHPGQYLSCNGPITWAIARDKAHVPANRGSEPLSEWPKKWSKRGPK